MGIYLNPGNGGFEESVRSTSAAVLGRKVCAGDRTEV